MKFTAMGVEGINGLPQKMSIRQDQVKGALESVGIKCGGDGTGYLEFCLMDRNFNNVVCFKEFSKYVKSYWNGTAFVDADSSYSASDYDEEECREVWRKIDPKRACKVPVA